MFSSIYVQGFSFLTRMIEKEPGVIVGPVSKVLGYILDFIFNICYSISDKHALGMSIILLTIIARTIILPLAFKSQKSMARMQKVQPEMDKIKNKYGDSKDPEIQRKMNAEIQALYAKEKVNPLAGCLPMLFTFPIFIALNYLMRQSYVFVKTIGDVYGQLTQKILEMPNFLEVIVPLATPITPDGQKFDISIPENLIKVVNKFNLSDWNTILANTTGGLNTELQTLYNQKLNIEMFLGINLVEFSGWALPGILIPILTGVVSALSSYVSMKANPSANSNPTQKSQQMMMMIVMPIMMFFFTVNMSAGVGIYWIISSIYQVVQQIILNRVYSNKDKEVVKA